MICKIKSIYTIREIFTYIFALLYNPNPNFAYGFERVNELNLIENYMKKKLNISQKNMPVKEIWLQKN